MYNLACLIFFPPSSQFRREPEPLNLNQASKRWTVWPLEIGYCFTLRWLLCHTQPPGKPGNMLPLCLFNHAKSCSTLGCFDISVINQFPLSIYSPSHYNNHVILHSVIVHSTWHLLRDPWEFFFNKVPRLGIIHYLWRGVIWPEKLASRETAVYSDKPSISISDIISWNI